MFIVGLKSTKESETALRFYSINSKSIEIQKDKRLHRIYFRVKDLVSRFRYLNRFKGKICYNDTAFEGKHLIVSRRGGGCLSICRQQIFYFNPVQVRTKSLISNCAFLPQFSH